MCCSRLARLLPQHSQAPRGAILNLNRAWIVSHRWLASLYQTGSRLAAFRLCPTEFRFATRERRQISWRSRHSVHGIKRAVSLEYLLGNRGCRFDLSDRVSQIGEACFVRRDNSPNNPVFADLRVQRLAKLRRTYDFIRSPVAVARNAGGMAGDWIGFKSRETSN